MRDISCILKPIPKILMFYLYLFTPFFVKSGKYFWDLYRNVLIVYYRTENVALV